MVSFVSLFRRVLNTQQNVGAKISEKSLNSILLLASQSINKKYLAAVGKTSKYSKKTELSKYKILRVLGQGSFGKVVLVRHIESRQLFAMKIIKKSKLTKKQHITRLLTEKSILQNVDNPFITKLHATFQTSTKLYIVMEFCPGGELFFHLSRHRKFSEQSVQFMAAEILLALEAIHKQGYIYRDLKPENILFGVDGHIRLCDFGLACNEISSFSEGTNSICGTPEYMSPEMLMKADYGFCVDYWAFGMIIYELLTGLPPWYSRDRQIFFQRVKSSPLKFPPYVSENAESLIRGLLCRNISNRYGVAGAEQLKCHPFFDGINWETISRKSDLKVPFNPCLETTIDPNAEDDLIRTINFDEQFTKMSFHNETYEESCLSETIWVDGFDTFADESTLSVGSSLASKVNITSYNDQIFTTTTQKFIKLSCSA